MKKKPMTMKKLMTPKPEAKLTGRFVIMTPDPPEGFRTLPQIFLEDFGIRLNEASGEWWRLEQNPVVNTELLDNLEHDLYYYITAGGSYGSGDVRLPLKDMATGEVTVPEGWTGPFTDAVWWDCDTEGKVHEFRIYCYSREPYHASQISVFLTRNAGDPTLFATQDGGSIPEPEPAQEPTPISEPEPEPALGLSVSAYRTLIQLFMEDFGIQIRDGEWAPDDYQEDVPVIDAVKVNSCDSELCYTKDNSLLTGFMYCGADTNADPVIHYFSIYNAGFVSAVSNPPYFDVLLNKSSDGYLFKRLGTPDVIVPETSSAPEPEPMAVPDPMPVPAPVPDPVPVPVPPPPTPPAMSALREVYETLSPQQLCTVVGLRTLLAKQQGISKKEAKKQLSGVLKALSDISALSGKSEIYGFGCFAAKRTKARTVKSHLGGYSGTYTLPKTTKSVFKPGKELKEKMSLVTGKTYEQIITALESLDAVKKAKAAVRKATKRGAKAKRTIAPKVAGNQTGK
ncbi:MAG TPA: HU family DNA-binding protein [Smithellaceae bacterium]|nr:HU family DNA-binding protein [Smithellaceae bacterium]